MGTAIVTSWTFLFVRTVPVNSDVIRVFAPFWSLGVAWNVHNESFWHAHEKNALKLRASVGSTGTTNFSSTQALTTYLYDFSREYNGNFGVSLAGYR